MNLKIKFEYRQMGAIGLPEKGQMNLLIDSNSLTLCLLDWIHEQKEFMQLYDSFDHIHIKSVDIESE